MYLALFGALYHSGPYLCDVFPEKIGHHDADCPHAQSIGENRFECKKMRQFFSGTSKNPAATAVSGATRSPL
jgi:hypothetical protein